MRPVEVIAGFLLLLSLGAQMLGGPISSGPYYASLIIWLPAIAFRGFLSFLGVRLPQILTFNQLQQVMFALFLFGGMALLFGGLMSHGTSKQSKS